MAHAETFESYTAFVRAMMAPGSRKAQLEHFGLGLIGELGEVSEPLKKHLFGGEELDSYKMLMEMGDVIWYVVAIAETLGVDLEDGMAKEEDEDGINYLIRKAQSSCPMTISETIFVIASFVGDVASTLLDASSARDALLGIIDGICSLAHQHFCSDIGEIIDINVAKLMARVSNGYYESYGVCEYDDSCITDDGWSDDF